MQILVGIIAIGVLCYSQWKKAAAAKKQQGQKDRPTQRYGTVPSGRTAASSGGGQRRQVQQRGGGMRRQPSPAQRPGDIFSRAAANVRENEANQLASGMDESVMQEQMMHDAYTLVNAIDISGESALMREVNDLIVMGYQTDLTFSRDFVAEGVEMLNCHEL